MNTTLAQSVVVITGASSGIARATALRLASRHASLVLLSRQEDALQDLARECERLGGRALAVKTDVADENQVRNAARLAADAFGRIDAWINAAAVTMLGRFEDTPADAYRRVIDTNFFGYVHGARAVLPYFRQQGRGVLINVGSILSKVGSPYASAYVSSKFAVAGFSESLRMELRDAPEIHVCTILPSTIDTPLFQHAANFTGRAVQAPPPVHDPELVVDAICQCLVKPQREICVGREVPAVLLLRTIAPGITERAVAAKMERDHFQDRPSARVAGNLYEPMPQFNGVTGGWRAGAPRGGKGVISAGMTLVAALGMAALYAWAQSKPRTPRPKSIRNSRRQPPRRGRPSRHGVYVPTDA